MLKMSAVSNANTPVLFASPLPVFKMSLLATAAPSLPAVNAGAPDAEVTLFECGAGPPPRFGALMIPVAGAGLTVDVRIN